MVDNDSKKDNFSRAVAVVGLLIALGSLIVSTMVWRESQKQHERTTNLTLALEQLRMEREKPSLEVNTHDFGGGAARVAHDLHQGLLSAGDESVFAVGFKDSDDDLVRRIDSTRYRNAWARFWLAVESALERTPASLSAYRSCHLSKTTLAVPMSPPHPENNNTPSA